MLSEAKHLTLTKAVPAHKSGARRGGSQTAPASLSLRMTG